MERIHEFEHFACVLLTEVDPACILQTLEPHFHPGDRQTYQLLVELKTEENEKIKKRSYGTRRNRLPSSK